MRPKNATTTKWSHNLAYAIGLLATDGNMSSDGRHIIFTSKDKKLIDSFKNCLKLNNKIGKKSSGSVKEKKYFIVQFGDVNFYRWCRSIGITPHKSKTIAAIKIPDKYFFDFLRGCFDGDGTSYAYWDKRWHSSYMFYLAICSASPAFIKWLQKKIEKLAKASGHISMSKGIYQLRFAKRETIILFDKMYYKNNLPYLKRKYDKVKDFLKINKEHAQVMESVDICA